MLQQITIIGNVEIKPKMRYTDKGIPVTNFTVAVNRHRRDQEDEIRIHTVWFRIAAWRRLAEPCAQSLTTGRRILVVGELGVSAWLDQDGSPRATLAVTA